MDFAPLPGGNLVETGLRDLSRGEETCESLLVSIGAPRLRRLGVEVPRALESPEHRLYAMLEASDVDSAHSRYNGLIRRLVSFEHALECAVSSTPAA